MTDANNSSDSPPWPATSSVLVALAALAINEHAMAQLLSSNALAPVTVVAPVIVAFFLIIASLFNPARFERGQRPVWLARVCAGSALLVYTLATTEHIHAFYYMNFVARLSGFLLVSECAVQHWQRPPKGESRGGVLVFLAAIVFVLASRTYITHFIKYFTPLFIVLLVLSMRVSRTRADRSYDGFHPWIAALFLATAMGGLGSIAVAANSNDLTRRLLLFLKPSGNSGELLDANARPQLGHSFNQPLSQKRVFRIEGVLAERHMRGQTFETYATTGGWGPAQDARKRETVGEELKARPGGERLIVTPLVDVLPQLYVPLHMQGIDAPTYRLEWVRTWGGSIIVTQTTGGPHPYQIAIVNDTFKGPLVEIMNPEMRARCLDVPAEFDPRVVEIARQISKGVPDTRDRLEEIRKYLWRNHSYSLNIEPGAGDPVANFLLHKMDGHCQFFASSAVLLARCMGVPARYITGYYAHESPIGNATLVRQRDAHAWAEVWVDGEGWITFDPTPSSGMPDRAAGISFWDKLLENLGDFAEAFGAWLRDAPASSLAILAGSVVVFFVALRALRKWIVTLGRNAPRIHYTGAGLALENLADGYNAWLKRHGIPCPPQYPWLDHIAALKRAIVRQQQPGAEASSGGRAPVPNLDWDAAEAFARAYTVARFGGAASPIAIQELKEKLRTLIHMS